jgi:predicted amidohydrolase
MNPQLQIALVQTQLFWEDVQANLNHITKLLDDCYTDTQLIILPEMFTSGFTMNPKKVAETMTGDTVKWLKQQAKTRNAAITGSLVIEENGHYYNRLLFVHPSGEIQFYNKRHTFTLAGEHKVYTAGNKQLAIDYLGWKICPLICYDLRFPVWARNTSDYDVLLYVANWPKPRVTAWDALLRARAIENMCYCIGVNRVGVDANNHEYSGHSAVYDVLGEQLTFSETEGVLHATLHKSEIETYRKKLQFLNDRDSFSLIG